VEGNVACVKALIRCCSRSNGQNHEILSRTNGIPAKGRTKCTASQPTCVITNVKVKLSRYSHADAKGERKYSFYLFLTSALDAGEWSASRPGRALPCENDPRYPRWAGWASELVWAQRLE
jgi:hypothetical protein